MPTPTQKSGRPRVYALQPLPGFANPDLALAAATLAEMSARSFDLIADLPDAALHFLPAGGNNTIAMLVLHMIAAESFWIKRVSGRPFPVELQQRVQGGMQDPDSGEMPPTKKSAAELAATGEAIRTQWTLPFLRAHTEPDKPVQDGDRTVTVRGALQHLVWHWTYHGGQVGLLRRLAGPRYQWTFDPKIGR